jgi:hypothetical protein
LGNVSKQCGSLGEDEFGQWLGVSHRVGRLMLYWILPASGIPISVGTVQQMTNNKQKKDKMRSRMLNYDGKLKTVFETLTAAVSMDLDSIDLYKIIDPDNEDPEFFNTFTRVIDDMTLQCIDNVYNIEVVSDPYVGIEFSLVRGGECEMIHHKSLIWRNNLGVDAMGYQLSHKRNKWTSVVRDKQSYIEGTILIQELQASCQLNSKIPMGRAQRRRLKEVTKNLEGKDSIAVQSTAGVCKLGFFILWDLIQATMISTFDWGSFLIVFFRHCLSSLVHF